MNIHPCLQAWSVRLLRALTVSWCLGAAGAATLDTITFGDAASESGHAVVATNSQSAQGEIRVEGAGLVGGAAGSGNVVGSNADGCQFRYQQLTGDGFIQARVWPDNTSNRQVRSGVMMRETLDPGAKMAFVLDNWWDQFGPGVLWRATTGQNTAWLRVPVTTKPLWMKIQRAGNVFTMSYSYDGATFTTMSTQTITMASTIYVGLAVCSGATDLFGARFDNISSSAPNGAWANTDLGVVGTPGKSEVYGLGETSRRLLPKNPLDYYGGDLVFNVAVDPNKQNYCTIKLWGGEANDNRLLLNIGDGNGNWFEIGSRHGAGELNAFVDNGGVVSPGAFWFRTQILPIWYTQGKSSVPIRVRSSGYLYAYGTPYNYPTYQKQMASPSRGIYRFYSHNDPVFTPAASEVLGTPPSYANAPTRSNAGDAAYLTTFKANYNADLTSSLAQTAPSGDTMDNVAQAYNVSWTNVYHQSSALTYLVAGLDAACQGYYSNVATAGASWGGAFGAHGAVITRIAPLIQAQLDTQIDLGGGAGLTRRTQYAAMLKASRDFGRMNRKTITNQAISCDFNIYKANAGLLALNSPDAYAEAAARRYVYEAVGLQEYGGNDVSVADPSPTWSMGRGFYMVTSRGTTHEGSWTSYDDYGRMAPYVFGLYRLNGDIRLRDRAVQMEIAHHVNMMYASTDSGGYRALLNEGVIACRNVFFPGKPSTVDHNIAATLLSPVLVGAAKQAMADGQYFKSWTESNQDVYAPDDYATLLAAPDPGNRPLQMPGQANSAWADEQNALVSLQYNGEQHFITFARALGGIKHFGDAHAITPQYQSFKQFWIDDVRYVDSGSYFLVGPLVENASDGTPPDNPVTAWNGQKQPYAIDEFGKNVSLADFYGTRYGDFVIGMNCTYGKTFQYAPAGFTSGVDLVSGQTMSAPVSVPPQTTVVFYAPLSGASAPDYAINPVPFIGSALVPTTSPALSWTAGVGATSHRVYFGVNPNPGASEYKGEQTGLTYAPGTLTPGTTYYWRVDEVNAAGVKTGVVWSFTTAGSGSLAWQSQDVGSVGVAGSYTVSNGTFTVLGSGADIWNAADSFRFVYVPVTGDCDFRARVVSEQNTGTNAKAGIMIRETLAANSTFVNHHLTPSSNSVSFQKRAATGGGASGTSSTTGLPAPYWVRLVRSGNTFAAYRSADGLTWTSAGSTTVAMASTVYAGLVVCANNNTVLNTSTFDNVSLAAPAAIPGGLAAVSGDQRAMVTWSASGNATSYTVKRSLNNGGPYLNVASGVTGTSYTDAGLTNGTTYYYVVSATSILGESLNSSAAAVTPLYAPPAVPAGFAVASGNGQAALGWTASPGATSYNVKRATTSGGAYAPVASGITGTSYTDTGLTNGTTYYYVVTAVGFGGESANSLQASTVPTAYATLPRSLQSGDIGAVGVAGGAAFASGVYTVQGSGSDVWGSADSFRFVYQQITGDCDVRVRVTAVQNTAPWAKAGVMVRDTLNANSPYALTFLSPVNGIAFQKRSTAGGSASSVAAASGLTAPYWVRVVRAGSSFTGYRSADGVTWTQLGSAQTITMGTTVYVGLAVCSVSNATLNTSTFDNFSVVSLPSPWVSGDVGAVGAAGSAKLMGTTYTITGSGADIWGAADAFRYAYQTATGDCDITARVLDVPNTSAWAKCGVMIRETLAADSIHADVNVTAANGIEFIRRTATGASATNTLAGGLGAPSWVRLTRVGNVFTAYRSADGASWVSMGSVTIPMAANVSIGLVTCGKNDGALCPATVDNVTVTP